ncbi:MAG: tRNA-guanine transglycosylase [Acidobacteriota bacterium]
MPPTPPAFPTEPTPTERPRLQTRRGLAVELPLFLPVYDRRGSLVPIDGWDETFGVEGCICNAFFLYKDRALRRRIRDEGTTLDQLLGYDGFLMTDSGAFQGFSGKLYLKNKKIVAFQDALRADVISPLDLVTPPGDKRTDATWKLERTLERIAEAKPLAQHAILAGVQQGGRFHDLRTRSLDGLLEIGIEYLALGSLVPFFNRNHDLGFVGRVTREARRAVGEALPIHIYGAGDPVELPFFYALGADIFDSASYGHYAQGGWYMTPWGAVRREQLHLLADAPSCASPFSADGPAALFDAAEAGDPEGLACHNLWTILDTVRRLRRLGRTADLEAHLDRVLARHQAWFPDSELESSWRRLNEQSRD